MTLDRVLVVTYFFPPVGGVGVQRTLKYVQYLPRWGWQPTIVAPRDPAYALRDGSLLAAVPSDVEVHRTLSLEPGRLVAMASRRLPAPGDRAGSAQPAVATDQGRRGARHGIGTATRRVLRRPLRGLARTWSQAWRQILFPDESIAWLPSALLAGATAIRRRRIRIVYSSSPPVSTHVIAGLLSAWTGLPWVADFRDPWIGNAFLPPPARLLGPLRPRLERWIVEHADRVVLAVDLLREDFVRRYPEHAAKFVHIPNGYDRADFAGLARLVPEIGRFRIVYAGSLYRPGELQAFLGGLELLLARRPELRSTILVEFVGRVNEGNARIGAEYAGPERLGDVVRFVGFVPRHEALARMAGADALLQLMPGDPAAAMFVGGKLAEYLALDRPILAVMPPGEGRTLVESLPVGRTSDVEPAAIADALERLVDDPPPVGPADPEGRYDRVNLARRLAEIFGEVVAARSGGTLAQPASPDRT